MRLRLFLEHNEIDLFQSNFSIGITISTRKLFFFLEEGKVSGESVNFCYYFVDIPVQDSLVISTNSDMYRYTYTAYSEIILSNRLLPLHNRYCILSEYPPNRAAESRFAFQKLLTSTSTFDIGNLHN